MIKLAQEEISWHYIANGTSDYMDLGLVAAFLGIKWQASSRENESLKQRLSPKKEKLYSDIIAFLSDYLRKGKKPGDEDFKDKIIEFEKGLLLHASNTVVFAYGDYMQNFFDKNISNDVKANRSFVLLGNLIIEMRKDLGHEKFINSLSWFDPLRLWLRDINNIVPKNKSVFRLSNNRISVPKFTTYTNEASLQKLIEQMNEPVTNDVGDVVKPPSAEKIISIQ